MVEEDVSVSTVSGLTREEQTIIDHLVTAWDSFVNSFVFAGQNDDDLVEFRRAVRHCQQLIMKRVAYRTYPTYWNNPNKAIQER